MSVVPVKECETAADVLRLAKESAMRRRAWNAQPVTKAPVKTQIEKLTEEIENLKKQLELNNLVEERDRLALELKQIEANELPRWTLADISEACAREFGISVPEIKSNRRSASVVIPRQIGFLISKILTRASLGVIGRAYGSKDHTTVLHAINKLEWLREQLLAKMNPKDPPALWAKMARILWEKNQSRRRKEAQERDNEARRQRKQEAKHA